MKIRSIQPNKKKIRKSLERKLDSLLKEAIILRDGYKCLRCQKEDNLQKSHIYPKGIYKNLKFDLDNLHFLCYQCHLCWWHKHPIGATKWIKDVLPKDRLARLHKKSNQHGIYISLEERVRILEKEIERLRSLKR